MIGQRIRQLRLARGLSLDALAAEMGGLVTKQALSKYEQGKDHPSAVVVTRLAEALGVKAAYLVSEPEVRVEFIGFRKGASLPKGEQARIQSLVTETLEQRVHLQTLIGETDEPDVPVHGYRADSFSDVEEAAGNLRQRWEMGVDPIANLTNVLEQQFVHVLEIDAKDRFDGISALAYDAEGHLRATAVVSRSGLPGERQRLDLAHELGHLVLQPSEHLDAEKAAFRFGGALLAPADVLRKKVGRKRGLIGVDELLLLKQQFGLSMQALLYRLHDLDVITDSYYRQWCIDISRLEWKRSEPLPIAPEKSRWEQQIRLRAISEGLLASEEPAERDTSMTMNSLAAIERRAFMKLPLSERRKILAAQAERAVQHYVEDMEWRDLEVGDFADE